METLELLIWSSLVLGVIFIFAVALLVKQINKNKNNPPIEIERKFLVKQGFNLPAANHIQIAQGYLNSHPERTVRIRISGNDAFLTIKGKGSETGMSRFEYEMTIEVTVAQSLLELCEPGQIRKVRYFIPHGRHTFEVDVFEGDNEGLVIAEVELKSEDEEFSRPDWLGEEVTGRNEYYNSALAKRPFNSW